MTFRPVQPRAQQINRKLADLAEAGERGLSIEHMRIGTTVYLVMHGRATKSGTQVRITPAGRSHLWQEQAA